MKRVQSYLSTIFRDKLTRAEKSSLKAINKIWIQIF